MIGTVENERSINRTEKQKTMQ